MKKSIHYSQKGIAPLVLIIIIAAVLVAGGAAYLFLGKKIPGLEKPGETVSPLGEEKKTGLEKTLDEVKVEVPKFDFSLSPLPDLKISALNLSVVSLPAIKPLAGFSVNTDFSFGKDIQISTPSYNFNPTINVPASTPSGVPTGVPTSVPTPTGAPQQTQGPQVDCSAFSAAPSCSLVGVSGSVEYNRCKECFPNK